MASLAQRLVEQLSSSGVMSEFVGAHLALLAVFIMVLLAVMFQVRPKCLVVMATLAEQTALTFEQERPEDWSLGQFRLWHQSAHSLDRREWRLGTSIAVCSIASLVGAATSAISVAASLFGIAVDASLENVMAYVMGGTLLAAVILLIHPVSFLLRSREHQRESER